MVNPFSPQMGLLSPDEQSQVRQNMLLQLGLGLLSQSGPSTDPVSFSQALGRAGMSAVQGQSDTVNQIMGTKAQKKRLEEEEKNKQREAQLSGLLNDTTIQAPDLFRRVASLGGEYTKMGLSGLQSLNNKSDRGEYFQPVQTADGVMAFDARRGIVVDPISGQRVTGRPVVGSSSDPSLQGKIAREKEFGQVAGQTDAQSNIKKPQQARETISLLNQADTLIDKATGSYAGAGRDVVAGAFGYATDGAKANAQLKVLQAGLMTNMPRMEGPQSDRDVQLYKEAAGQIGDPTVPNDIKKAAVSAIRIIQEKYASRGQSDPQTWEEGGYLYRKLPDGTIQRKKK